jgi:hypothetical protein
MESGREKTNRTKGDVEGACPHAPGKKRVFLFKQSCPSCKSRPKLFPSTAGKKTVKALLSLTA